MGEVIVKTKALLQGSGVLTAKSVEPILSKALKLKKLKQGRAYQPKPTLKVPAEVREAARQIAGKPFRGEPKEALKQACEDIISKHLKGPAKARDSVREATWIKQTAEALEKVCLEAVPKSLSNLTKARRVASSSGAYGGFSEYVNAIARAKRGTLLATLNDALSDNSKLAKDVFDVCTATDELSPSILWATVIEPSLTVVFDELLEHAFAPAIVDHPGLSGAMEATKVLTTDKVMTFLLTPGGTSGRSVLSEAFDLERRKVKINTHVCGEVGDWRSTSFRSFRTWLPPLL